MRRRRFRYGQLLPLALGLASIGTASAAIYTYVDPKSGLTIMSNKITTTVAQAGAVSPPSRATRSALALAPVAFPRIDSRQQKELDADRRAILLEELSSEQDALAVATLRGAQQEELNRHAANIAALRRELQRLP